MEKEALLTAIDVGTTKVCTIVSRIEHGKGLEILGVGVAPSQGLRKGTVIDIEATEKAVRASVELAEAEAGLKVLSAYVGVTGSHIDSMNQWTSVEVSNHGSVIMSQDLAKAKASAYPSETLDNRQIVHVIPRSYSLDGVRGIRNPIGMHTQSLQLQTHMVTGAASLMANLVQAVQNAGVKVRGMILEPLASGEAVLTPEERETGVVMVDIGGGTSDIAVFKEGTILYTAVIPVGGYQFSNDISMAFDTPYLDAEEAKVKYGHTAPEMVDIREEVELPVSDGENRIKVPRRELCQLIKERTEELLQLVKVKLEQAEMGYISDTKLVFTGGSANLPGLEDMARKILTTRARIGVPSGIRGMPEKLVNPSYSTSVGMLRWCGMRESGWDNHSNGRVGLLTFYTQFIGWLKNIVRAR